MEYDYAKLNKKEFTASPQVNVPSPTFVLFQRMEALEAEVKALKKKVKNLEQYPGFLGQMFQGDDDD